MVVAVGLISPAETVVPQAARGLGHSLRGLGMHRSLGKAEVDASTTATAARLASEDVAVASRTLVLRSRRLGRPKVRATSGVGALDEFPSLVASDLFEYSQLSATPRALHAIALHVLEGASRVELTGNEGRVFLVVTQALPKLGRCHDAFDLPKHPA